ncbi:hypothetical protein [Paraglaciecola sp. 2405UD69-4]|uniref:hypothetical protein n=1 Tax=Paraglaciecola sp. 2405UD69-4 TaxID=3391836 RepID=UPI0039C9D5D5
MKVKVYEFHPLVKFSAYVGALLCLFFSVFGFIAAVLELPDIWESLMGISKSWLVLYLSWSFWFAAKFSTNPVKAKPFSKSI